ncbi:MAG TPA: hypothetical protein VK866_13430, partial [Acidimicrobiales bacterium]|nr:hypothetical protein [Acidimicrobiales bacterium]
LRAALDRVIASYDAEIGATGDDDVQGFSSGRLQIGSLDATVRPGSSTSWRDGCWGFSTRDDGGYDCGWYQDSTIEQSCIWMKSTSG